MPGLDPGIHLDVTQNEEKMLAQKNQPAEPARQLLPRQSVAEVESLEKTHLYLTQECPHHRQASVIN